MGHGAGNQSKVLMDPDDRDELREWMRAIRDADQYPRRGSRKYEMNYRKLQGT